MSYDETMATRLRMYFAEMDGVVEQRMMGALCFMVDGHMCCGVAGPALMVRVGRENYEKALSEPHVKPMELSKRTPRGFVLIDPEGVESDANLKRRIERGQTFVRALTPKNGED